MIIFYLCVGIIYVILMGALLVQWDSPSKNILGSKEKPSVTLLIPFRKEAQNISRIFDWVNDLEFRNLEIIWIDDHSEDDSLLVLGGLLKMKQVKNSMKVIAAKGEGKKAAISTGVEVAKGEIIVTTDADCQMACDWIDQLVKPFNNPTVQLVAGPVLTLKNESFFARFQQADWASILLVSHAGFANGMPLMCSGANLAYRKSAFSEVKGFDGNSELLSGDDEFILKKIVSRYGQFSTIYLQKASSLVTTLPFESVIELLRQRIRWASKWNAHHSLKHAFSAFFPLLIQLVFLSSFCLVFLESLGIVLFVLLWAMKIISEKLILGKILENYGVAIGTFSWIGISLLHPFYVIITALGAIQGKFEWKGRINTKKN